MATGKMSAVLKNRARQAYEDARAKMSAETPAPTGYKAWAASKRTDERTSRFGIENLWTDEHHAQLQSQGRDMLVSQYGAAASELHRQFVSGQLTPAEYSSALAQFKMQKAGALAGASRDLDIARTQQAQELNITEAQLNASRGGGATVMRGSGKDEPQSAEQMAAEWARGEKFTRFGQMRPADWSNAPAGVQSTFRRYWQRRNT